MPTPTLKRSLSLPLITFYGLGTILGAGIYVLIGEVAGHAGMRAPWGFLIASLLATFSALSYAELSSRFPLSAGEAVYLQRAFGIRNLSRLVGLMIVFIGVVSTATLVNGFVGYFRVFVDAPPWLIISVLVFSLGGLAAWGINQSAWAAAVTTWVELGGLLLVLAVAGENLSQLPSRLPEMLPSAEPAVWAALFAGAFVAFYAFIGFEDIVNVAEEVREPERNLPRAVIYSLAAATGLYMLIAVVAVLSVPPTELANSEAPLALVYERATGREPLFISLIGLSAVINGALIQIIMASRVLYGMASQGWLPRVLADVHPITRTPLKTTFGLVLLIWVLALWLPLLTLAQTTSLITLVVFALVNLALWRVKRHDPADAPRSGLHALPAWIPLLGFVVSLAFVLFQIWQWLS